MAVSSNPQLALDERAINDPELEAALNRHLRASDDVREANAVKKTYRKEIDAALAKHGEFPVDDFDDLRPTGEVNADALRGEVERASEPTPFRPRAAGRCPCVTH